VLAPWAYRNWRVLGHWIWTSTNTGFTAYDGFNPDATGASDQRFWRDMPQLSEMSEVQRSQYLTERARAYVRQHPRRAIELAGKKAGRMWSPMPLSDEFGRPLYVAAALAFSLPIDLLVMLGLWRRCGEPADVPATATTDTIARINPGAPAKMFLLMPAVYLTVIHALSVGSLRYRIPAEVPMAVLAACGLAGLWRGVRRDSLNDAVAREA
jgi:hypothetical protein